MSAHISLTKVVLTLAARNAEKVYMFEKVNMPLTLSIVEEQKKEDR